MYELIKDDGRARARRKEAIKPREHDKNKLQQQVGAVWRGVLAILMVY